MEVTSEVDMRDVGWVPLILGFWWVFTAAVQAQTGNLSQDKRIHVEVNLVTLRFTVKDRAGLLINDLNKEAFQIFEDGIARETVFFEPPRNAAGQAKRLWLAFLLDVSGSTFATRSEEIIAARTFFDNVDEVTQIGIFGFTDKLLTFQDFTANRNPALRAFSRARQHLGRTAIYDSIKALVSSLNRRARRDDRKVIITISDGMDDAYAKATKTAVLARMQNITLYTILVPSGTQLYVGPASDGLHSELSSIRLAQEQSAKELAFARLSQQTGGKHYSGFEAILDFDETLAQINDDIFGNLYALGYYTNDPYRDKEERNIRVEVARPDVVISRLFKHVPERLKDKRKFIAALFDDQEISRLSRNLGRPLHEIGAELDILPARREGGKIGLPFRIKINPFTLRVTDEGDVRTQLGAIGLLRDQQGKEVVRLREFFHVKLGAKEIRGGQGIIYTNKLFAPPGVYELKIALVEVPTWKMTAFEHTVSIEDR